MRAAGNFSMLLNQVAAVVFTAVVPAVPADWANTIMGAVFLACGLCLLPVREVQSRQHAQQQQQQQSSVR